MPGFYEIRSNAQGEFSFVLKADNDEIILRSELYASKAMAEKGIAAVRTNCVIDDRYVIADAKDGSYYFNLKAGNDEIVGTSETYTTKAAREKGIASVKSNGLSTNVQTIA